MVQNENAKPGSQYLEKFKRYETESGQPAWVLPLRRAGINSFMDQGFPTLHDEDWRFTNVAPIAKLPFKPVFDGAADGSLEELLDRSPFARLEGSRLVFVDGHYSPLLS